jgi:serine/threonine-protein kinase
LSVLDIGVSDGALFLVMPLVAGGSLEDARATFGNAAWAKPLLRQIADGLGALHARDIVHRDLKPANILIADAQPLIADFGLAGLGTDPLGDTQASTGLTMQGDVFGTPGYMAPELATGVHDAKPSSDIFSFGIIAYEMLTGRQPFVEPPIVARMHGRAIAPRGPTDAIVMRCLSIDPDAPPTARDLADGF